MLKKLVLYLGLIICGNILLVHTFYSQNEERFIALASFLLLAYLLFKISALLSSLFISRWVNSAVKKSDKLRDKKARGMKSVMHYSFLTIFLLLLGGHVFGYIQYSKYQDQKLDREGIFAITTIKDQEWKAGSKNSKPGYWVYYDYQYEGRIYARSQKNDTLQLGDTIVVKFLKENPNNHIIYKK